jgi:hypothetical protein
MRVYCLVVFIAFAFACSRAPSYTPASEQIFVETNPGTFTEIEQRDWSADDERNTSRKEKSKLRIHFGDDIIDWEGSEIPVVLREKNGMLYLVGYDRDTGLQQGNHVPRFSYFRQDGEKMLKIRPDEFPKEIATQNMWWNYPERLEAILNFDTSTIHFQGSSNAFIWQELLTGKTTSDGFVEKELLDEFIKKFNPRRLTVIVKEVDNAKNKNGVQRKSEQLDASGVQNDVPPNSE